MGLLSCTPAGTYDHLRDKFTSCGQPRSPPEAIRLSLIVSTLIWYSCGSLLRTVCRATACCIYSLPTNASMHLMKLLCERLRWVSDLIEESSFLAGPARVARRLSVLVENYGRPLPGGGTELAISQAELGQFLGISR